jgi:class 3 adenylate cyclase/tetratricopeptide (TPR) repeat protein
MKCLKCGHENRTGAKFCEECAAALARSCVNCGAELSSTAKFCSQCAHPVDQTGPCTPSLSARFVAPHAYTPKHLAAKIITSKGALEGERKQVTVLFADLKGSMELLAERDPEEARKLLDPVLEHMIEAVHRYEGTVNQVMGDGIMALFGAPLAHEDHAIRACYAALRMQESVKHFAAGLRRAEGIAIQIRVGVNSGEVVVRSIGSDLHMDYTAVGQTTHLAARMEQMAVPGTILISADTMNLAEGYLQIRPLGPLPIKGLAEPIEVYEIVAATSVRSRLHAAAARGLTRFVGRERELGQLREALDHAGAGHGQIVAVIGEPGVGKSRLFWEFTHSHRTQGWLLVDSTSVSYGKATSFLPIVDLLRGYFQIAAGDEARRIREKVTGRLLSLDRALEPFLPALLWLLDVPVEDGQWQKIDAPQRRQRALDGIKRLLLRESQVQPLLVLFEDLHWIDSETQALLDSLIESLPTARLLLLVNYRPEYRHGWNGKTYYRQIGIDPLPAESAGELLEALLGKDPGLQPLKRLLIERTEGNPFFLEESVRTLVETKALAGERGSYQLVKASENFQIPATAQAILAGRIDRLSPEDKRLLQAASVIGKDVPLGLLQAIADEGEEALRRSLNHLQAAEYLYEARLFPELEYTLKHALTHEVAYGTLLHDRRRALHTKIVVTIETLYPDRLSEQIDRLAHHALRGEVWEKALVYLRQAGARAMARSANREAVAYFQQALTVLAHLPETHETIRQAIDIRFELRNCLFLLGELEGVLGYLDEAERLARTIEDDRRLGWVSAYMGHYFWWMGNSTQARACTQRAQIIAETAGDFPLQIAANLYLGFSLHTAGDYEAAAHVLRKVAQSLQGKLSVERFGQHAFPAVNCRSHLVWTLAELGAFDEGIAQGREGIRLAETIDHVYSLVVVCWGLGCLYTIKGDYSEAIRLLDRALAFTHDWDLRGLTPMMTAASGHAYALSGRVADGLALLRQGVTAMESMHFTLFHSFALVNAAEACVLDGQFEEALAFADRALMLTRQRGEHGFEAWALRVLGEIALHRDRPDLATAEAHYGTAVALASELGMRPLVAHCHLGLCKLYHQTGKREQVHEPLTTATAMYREMNMQFWLQKAAAEIRQL